LSSLVQATATSPVLPSGSPANVGSTQLYGITQLPSPGNAYTGPYQLSGSSVGPSSRNQNEQSFPASPNQPEYHYYSKPEELPFAPSYRYHKPPDMSAPKVNAVLSPAGLPLRPVMVSSQLLCTLVPLIQLWNISPWFIFPLSPGRKRSFFVIALLLICLSSSTNYSSFCWLK